MDGLGTEVVDHLRVACLKPQNLSIVVGDEQKDEAVEVGELRTLAIGSPVERIALQDDAVAGSVVGESKGPQAGEL